MSINVSDIITQFGAYYKAGSDNAANLRNKLYAPSETAAFFQNRPTSDTIYRGTYASLDRVVQPFQKAFTPIGAITFEPNSFNLYELKIDKNETPDDLAATYEGFLADLDTNDRTQWPFVRWLIDNHIMPKKDEDLEINEYFTGIYAAPTPGTAGAAGTAMNGLKKTITDYNTGGRTNLGNGPIAMGAPADDPSDFVVQIESFAASIPKILRPKIDFIFMNQDLGLRYKQGKKKLYNTYYAAESDLLTVSLFPNMVVQPLTSMGESNMIWTSIPTNRIRPQKRPNSGNALEVKEFSPRQVSMFGDWWEALNFEVPEYVISNDQE